MSEFPALEIVTSSFEKKITLKTICKLLLYLEYNKLKLNFYNFLHKRSYYIFLYTYLNMLKQSTQKLPERTTKTSEACKTTEDYNDSLEYV